MPVSSKNEEAERKRRSTNIIIREKDELLSDEDKLYVEDLMDEICAGSVQTKIDSIGMAAGEKYRPINVSFSKESEKEKVMSS